MNFELDPHADLERLAHEELTNSEVRVLLERLSMKDVGPANPTVGAVAEVCGVSTMVVGRMLAEIRQANLHELYGRTLETHGEKIEHLGKQVGKIAQTSELDDEIRRDYEKKKRAEEINSVIAWIVVFFSIIAVLALASSKSRTQMRDFQETIVVSPQATRDAVTRVLPNGDILRVDESGKSTVFTDSGERAPTKEELKLVDDIPFKPAPLRRIPPTGR